jgi:hypothetical protein
MTDPDPATAVVVATSLAKTVARAEALPGLVIAQAAGLAARRAVPVAGEPPALRFTFGSVSADWPRT